MHPALRLVLMAALSFAATPAPAAEPAGRPQQAGMQPVAPAGTVALAPRPGTPMDAAARQLVSQDLAEAGRAGEAPLLLVGTAPLGTASDRQALFVQLQSARECGSAGCSTTVYLWQRGAYKRVLDGVSGPLRVGPGRTGGMADLSTEKERWTWTGTQYQDTRPAPSVDLRPRRPARRS